MASTSTAAKIRRHMKLIFVSKHPVFYGNPPMFKGFSAGTSYQRSVNGPIGSPRPLTNAMRRLKKPGGRAITRTVHTLSQQIFGFR